MNSGIQLGFGSLADIGRAVWRRKSIFAAVSLLLFVLATLYILQLKPRYNAESLLLLPQTPVGTLTEGNQRLLVSTDPMTLRSEVDILGSNDLIRRVIDSLDLASNPEFAAAPRGRISEMLGKVASFVRTLLGRPVDDKPLWSEKAAREDGLMSAYRSRLYIFNDGRSTIVHVGFTAASPELASDVANAHAKAYLDAQVERRVGGQRLALGWLKSELEGRAKEMRDADEAVQTYRARNNLIPVQRANQQTESLAEQELRQVNEQLVNARNDVTRERARLVQFEDAAQSGDAGATTDVLNSPVLMKLRQREVDARSTLARMTTAYGSGSVVNGAQAELDSIRDTVKRELARTRDGIRADLDQAQSRVAMFERRMQDATQNKIKLDQAGIELKGHETYAAAKRSIYEVVLSRYNTVLAEQGFNAADAKVISPATVPTQPAFPKTSLFVGFAALFSMAAAAGAAFAADRLRTGIRSLRAHCAALDVDVLGVVPIVGGRRARFATDAALQNQLFWERMRGIRNRVIDVRSRECLVVLVTSALPQEGKSVFAAAFARAVASTGIETILIDGDLRRPTAASRVGVREVNSCLSEVLTHQISLQDAIVSTGRGNLALLPARPGHGNHADALATESMDALLRTLRGAYRVIVIDSPPLAAASDALSLSALADKTLVVARPGQTNNARVSQTVRMLRDHHAQLSGVVLIGDDEDDMFLGSELANYYSRAETVTPKRQHAWRRRLWPFAKAA